MARTIDAHDRGRGASDDFADRVRNLSENVGHGVPPECNVRPREERHIRRRVRCWSFGEDAVMVQSSHMSDIAAEARAERREWRVTGIVFFALLALLLLYAAFVILRPFITAILLGAILVTLTFGVYVRVRDRLKGRSALAAVVMLVAVTLLIVLPFTII